MSRYKGQLSAEYFDLAPEDVARHEYDRWTHNTIRRFHLRCQRTRLLIARAARRKLKKALPKFLRERDY